MSISHAEIQAESAAKLLGAASDPQSVAQARELFRQAQQAALLKAEEAVALSEGAPASPGRRRRCFTPLLKVQLRWAEAENGRKQFKAAKRLYEELVTHDVFRDLAAAWLSYAGFCAARGKVKAARKVYVRGCQTPTLPSAQSDVLYGAFLAFENAIIQASMPAAVERTDGDAVEEDTAKAVAGEATINDDPASAAASSVTGEESAAATEQEAGGGWIFRVFF